MKQFRQSPINFNTCNTINKDKKILFSYHETNFMVQDNLSNIVLIPQEDSNYIEVEQRKVHLTEIHFHRPSEHYIDNAGFDMEIHLVHQENHFTIVYGVLLKLKNNGFDFGEPFSNVNRIISFDLNKLLVNSSCYQYYGSFTTTPYEEKVIWVVNKQVLPISTCQATLLSTMYPENNRCLQVLNDRPVYEIDIFSR